MKKLRTPLKRERPHELGRETFTHEKPPRRDPRQKGRPDRRAFALACEDWGGEGERRKRRQAEEETPMISEFRVADIVVIQPYHRERDEEAE